MKKLIIFVTTLLICCSQTLYSQIDLKRVVKNVQKKTEKKIESKIEKTLNNGVDSVLERTEKGIKNGVSSKTKKDSTALPQTNQVNNNKSNSTIAKSIDPQQYQQLQPTLEWSTYDFVPGTEIIFEDDFKNEKNGEFPSRWDMVKGGLIENAVFDGVNVVYFKKTNANVPHAITPLLKVSNTDYLPEEFTIELDCYFGSGPNGKSNYTNTDYYLFLYDIKNQKNIMSFSKPIRISFNKLDYNLIGDTYPGISDTKQFTGWRHVSISFNKRALKCYLDDKRLVNIPNCDFNPTGVMLSYHNVSGNNFGVIKNVKIAKGAVPLYDKILSDGKFVTHGIKFDVNKATIKSESMGTINYVYTMMKDNPNLNFSVEGHTDSDGDNSLNQSLSDQRAKAVMNQLISMGIAESRLKYKGWGETKPMSDNNTPEGKANNRRVEFVKF